MARAAVPAVTIRAIKIDFAMGLIIMSPYTTGIGIVFHGPSELTQPGVWDESRFKQ